MSERGGIVVFGDVVGSRRLGAGAPIWLEQLCRELDETYADERLAGFEFTQGDELQGLLTVDADPLRAVLRGALPSRHDAPPMRWAVVYGDVEAGQGPATRRTGPAFLGARETIDLARRQADSLLMRTGDPDTDELLDGTAPVLGTLLHRLTDRQREIARLALVHGLRQADIADRLGIRRATVSVAFGRADIRSLTRLLAAIRALWRAGIRAADRHDARAAT
jgi:DNA-binding CsgD family transcriptional regulator